MIVGYRAATKLQHFRDTTWIPYARFTKHLQRCWAHLLRESKDLSEKFEEAIPLHNALKELYEILTTALENG